MRKSFFILFLSYLHLCAITVYGAKPPYEPPPKPAPPSTGLEKTFLEVNTAAASQVKKLGRRVDMFLSGQKYTSETNETSITLKNAAYWQEGQGDDIDFNTQFDIRLHLPNLESKWALRFTSYDEDQDEVGVNKRRPQTRPRRENYGTSIAILQKLGNIDVTFRPRVQLKNGLETSHLLRLTSRADVKKILIEPSLEFFARPDAGTGQFASIVVAYDISKGWVFTVANDEQYVNNENRLSTNHEVSATQSIREDKSIKYALLYQMTNKPRSFNLQEYSFYLSYVHAMAKEKLYYNVTPRLFFNRENGFRPRNAMTLGVDIVF